MIPVVMEQGTMTDFATDLKKMFNATMSDRLEAYWLLPDGKSCERSEADQIAIGIFEILLATVDAIPQSLIKAAEDIRDAQPDKFEDTLLRGLRSVSYGFSAASATEFAEALTKRFNPT
jgi:hypothetical protein